MFAYSKYFGTTGVHFFKEFTQRHQPVLKEPCQNTSP